ncbi:MAG TPA: NAD(P)-dependent alcohol dehydrogenase [Longimicrobiaceae bacterium]|nr:NAD(P)-dependent alcohol dehydrogenase [Longimicrobiaceae bacterium]
MMRAAICTRYGPPEVLEIRDVPRPSIGGRDLLVRVEAATVSVSDCYIRSGIPTASLAMRMAVRLMIGFRGPRRPIPGAALAGTVEETGRRVTRFRAGDRVHAFTMMRMGACAEYARVPEKSLVVATPDGVTAEEAAGIPYGGMLALHSLRKAEIRPGDPVVVYGASGAIGTAAVQLAKHFGAEVTAVCGTGNLELVRALGADAVLDYTRDDTPGDRRYALVFDAVGRRKTSPLKDALKTALTPGGRFLSVDDSLPRMRKDDFVLLTELAAAGTLKPVIGRRYPLEQIAEAHRYVEERHKQGNVVITMNPSEPKRTW